MPDFSVILQTPQMRSLVQENALDRLFHEGLYPALLFRSEAEHEKWEANVGDDKVFTGKGLMKPRLKPLIPGQDPTPHDYGAEQWRAQCQKWADTIDTHMPSSNAAAVKKITEDLKELGKNAGLTLNRLVRNKIANSTVSGWTVADGTQGSSTTIRVKRLNGLTRARRPDLANGSPVRYEPVTASNPLPVTIVSTARNIVGFTPDTPGDEVGPGTITLDVAIGVTDRDAIFASTRTFLVRSGGGNATDALSAGTDILHLADLRSAVQRLRNVNVAEFGDGSFHAHLDPTSEGQCYSDNEFQRLQISLPDGMAYRDFAIARLLGCTFFRNNECPQPDNVDGGSTATFSQDDPYAGELFHNGASSGAKVHRVLILGQGALKEYYVDQNELLTEAGVNGKVEQGARISNGGNGVDMNVERIQVIMRAPQDRLQENVAQTWKFQGDFVMRTDGATGDAAMYKRCIEIQHTE